LEIDDDFCVICSGSFEIKGAGVFKKDTLEKILQKRHSGKDASKIDTLEKILQKRHSGKG
jgi:hypothetical protein